MTNINDSWERLSQVIEASGLTIHAFALAIGLSCSQTLYQIKRGQIGISRNVAEAVTNRYPEYSMVWLQTGLGSMYADSACKECHIPYYSCELARISDVGNITPDSYMFLPQIGHADFAISYHGEDMTPSVPNGSMIILSQIDATSIIYGNEYVVEFNNIVLLRRIRKGSDESNYRLVANDSSRFDDVVIRRSDISALYAVKAKLMIQN